MAHANPYVPAQVETLADARMELVRLAETVNRIIDNQKQLQRDDGCLMDCAVVPHTLSDEVVRMMGHFELLGAYAARPYQPGQVVTYRDRMYVCAAAHHGGAVMDMAQWRLLGKAGCGCDGGGVRGGGGCEPKTIYIHPQNAPHNIYSANGCLQWISTKQSPQQVVLQEGETVDVFWLFDYITDGQVTFKNITTTEGVDVQLMDSAAYVLIPPLAMYIHYQLIRINNDVFVRLVDASGVGNHEEDIPERWDV